MAWVMPASHAWHGGVRPDMRVVSIDGADPRSASSDRPMAEAELLSSDGRSFVVRAPTGGAITGFWALVSLWLTGGVFAFLGAAVLLRRPDAPVARLFGLFTGLTALALGVSPAAGGPHTAWSLVVEFMSLLALAASLPAFAIAFVGNWGGPRRGLGSFWLAGGILVSGYLASILIQPDIYSWVRTGFALYLVAGILAALFVLGKRALASRPGRSARDARLALSGIACGTLPFVGLTLIPQAAMHADLVPARVTAAVWAVIPVTFAYAILRHQVLGIRRLVHRGMVHGITTAVLLAVMLPLVVASDTLVNRLGGAHYPAAVTAALLAVGVLLFQLLGRGVRGLVDRFLYHDEVDSRTLLAGMRCDLLGSERAEEVVAAMVRRLRESLRLEASILFLGGTAQTPRVAASSGPRADETIAFVRSSLTGLVFDEDGLSELRWKSDVLLVARLETGSDRLGFLVLGPKEGGEIILREERRTVETVTPILSLAIRQTTLLAELREVSERLTDAQEAERARIARDLHDGPLQKAILLGAGDGHLRDRNGVARELASELRELCARLRPAILDDLGLVPALEWLLEQTAQGFTVTPRLTIRGMTEDDRLAPGTELALFRVTQEAVSNALKHGHPTSILVSLTRTGSGVELSVADDGHAAVVAGDPVRGLGISGMRERLRQVGGSVAVALNGRMGTMVTARVPHPVEAEQ